MAEYLGSYKIRTCCVALLLMAGMSSVTRADDLVDPTRPPASLGMIRSDDALATSSGPLLQSVLISPGRRVAVISGHTVQVGEKVGDATVVNIADNEVTLRSGKSMQTLKLFPGIEKRPAHDAAYPKSTVGGNKGKR